MAPCFRQIALPFKQPKLAAPPSEEAEAEDEARLETLPVGSPNCQPCTIVLVCW